MRSSTARAAVCLVLSLVACKSTSSEKTSQPDKVDKSASAPKADEPKQASLAKLTVSKLAFEAYGTWAVAHPDKTCPDAIDDLVGQTDLKDGNDPWGNRFRLLCGPTLPAGARGIAIVSNGPDGKPDTADDVKSWD